MFLEKDKVYKIIHSFQQSIRQYDRDYIICSPREDIEVTDGSVNFDTHFTVCFNGKVTINRLIRGGGVDLTHPSETSISTSDVITPLKNEDIEDVRKAIGMLGERYKYNRRINKLIIKYESNR